jgi:hypothetical protein
MATPDIAFALADFTVEVSGAGYPVQLSPDPTMFGTTNSSGEVTFSNVTPGIYVLNAPGTGIPSLRITVPDEAGPLDAIDLVNTGQGWVAPGGTPEGRIAAPPQSRYYDPVNDVDYVKATGTGNTGWQELVATLLLMLWTVSAQAADPRVRGTAVVPRSAIESTAYNATSWNGNTNAATKDALRDKIETLGSGGETVWTNSAGIVTPASGQTATNRLQFTSGAEDNATNAAVVVDTDAAWTSGSLLALRQAGTNALSVGPNGGIYADKWEDWWVTYDPDIAFLAVRGQQQGSTSERAIIDLYTSQDMSGNAPYADFWAEANLSSGTPYVYTYGDAKAAAGSINTYDLQASADGNTFLVLRSNGTNSFIARPFIADGSTPYELKTTKPHTTGNLAEIENFGTNSFSVAFDGSYITQAGVVKTPSAANATGTAGTWAWDASFIYICVATDTWKRVAIATW